MSAGNKLAKLTEHWADGLCSFLTLLPLCTSDNNKLSSVSCGNTKKASILLVRKLYTLMQNLGPLPDNVCLNMKLAYYDDGSTHQHNCSTLTMIKYRQKKIDKYRKTKK